MHAIKYVLYLCLCRGECVFSMFSMSLGLVSISSQYDVSDNFRHAFMSPYTVYLISLTICLACKISFEV